MAVAILFESSQIQIDNPSNCIFLGELSLDGRLKSVRGIVGRILGAKKLVGPDVVYYVPHSNLEQALLIPDITVKPSTSLRISF